MNDNLSATGYLHVIHTKEDNSVQEYMFPNLVVTTGRNFIASRMSGASAAVMGWIAVGSGSTTPNLTDTTLQTEITRKATTVSGGTPSGNSVTFSVTLLPGEGTGNLYEAGILNNSSGGTLLSRTTFGLITKAAGDTLTIGWTITVN